MDLLSRDRRARASVAALSALIALLAAAPAAAQRGAGSRLDDPTGRTPVEPRPEVEREAPPDVPGQYAQPTDEAVPPPPGGYPREPGTPSVDLRTRARLNALDATWQVLGARGGPNWFGGIVGILGGGLEIALGAIFLEVDSGGAGELIAPYFITLGVTTVVRSALVDLILAPDPRPTAIRYATMPAGTPEEAEARLEFGERELAALAEYSMIVRIVDASLSIAGALAVIPAYLAPNDWMLRHELEALVFLGPAVSLIFAIVTLASPSAAEQRWDAYRQMRDRLTGESGGVSFTPGFSVDPNGGGFATLTARF